MHLVGVTTAMFDGPPGKSEHHRSALALRLLVTHNIAKTTRVIRGTHERALLIWDIPDRARLPKIGSRLGRGGVKDGSPPRTRHRAEGRGVVRCYWYMDCSRTDQGRTQDGSP